MSAFKPYTPGKLRKKFSDAEKLDQVFMKFKELEWSLTDFLYKVFACTNGTGKAITCSQRHLQAVTATLNGTSKPFFIDILESIYENAVAADYRANDATAPSN